MAKARRSPSGPDRRVTVPTALATDRPTRIQQVYGYAVCLVAIITLLISINGLVNAAFERADPLHAGNRFGDGAALSSFEAYRATRLERGDRPNPVAPGAAGLDSANTTVESEAELRARYEALRADQIASAQWRAMRSLVVNAILVALAVALFAWHWSWLRRLGGG